MLLSAVRIFEGCPVDLMNRVKQEARVFRAALLVCRTVPCQKSEVRWNAQSRVVPARSLCVTRANPSPAKQASPKLRR